ncbi:MAG TPA: hypothetical protein VM681_04195 [Candidatus Thermoplasmatota archaeon]|nr:hypothetical protein [Candidatus Thermoplasmatota archaeon]
MVPGILLVLLYFLHAFQIADVEQWLDGARVPLGVGHLFFLGLGLLIGGAAIASLRHAMKPQKAPPPRTTDRVKPLDPEALRREDTPPHRASAPSAAPPSQSAPAAPPPDLAPSATASDDLADHPVHQQLSIEEEIKQLNRQISRANVKLGLGELSKEGYKQYTDKLRERKALLESKLEEQRYKEQSAEGAP